MPKMMNDYEIAKLLLSQLEYGKPTPLKALVNATGMTYNLLMPALRPLIQSGLISRSSDERGVIYTLRHLEYESDLEKIYGMSGASCEVERAPHPTATSNDTESASDVRKSAVWRSAVHRRVSMTNVSSPLPMVPESNASSNAVDSDTALTAARRSSTELPFFDRKISQQMTAKAIPSRDIPVSGSFKRIPSSTTLSGINKSVYVNTVSNTSKPSVAPSRSMFTGMPPQSFNQDMHRTDTNFKLTPVSELPERTAPILAHHSTAATREEYSEDMIRTICQDNDVSNALNPMLPLIAISDDTTSHQLWSSFSALANSGGGFILLGVRKHGISYRFNKIPSLEDKLKIIAKEFGDRSIISDSPKGGDFIRVCSEGKSKKQFITIIVNPDMIERLPVYTKLDSFGDKRDGCYCLKNGEVTHCSEDETKALWKRFYLLEYNADWDQSGEMLATEMSRKLSLEKIEPPEGEKPYLTTSQISKSDRKTDQAPNTQTVVAYDEDGEVIFSADTPAAPIPAIEISKSKKDEAENKKHRKPVQGSFAMEYDSRHPDHINPAEIVAERRKNEEEARLAETAKAASTTCAQAAPETNVETPVKSNFRHSGAFGAVSHAMEYEASNNQAAISANDAIKASILFSSDIRGPKIRPNELAAIRARIPDVQSTLFDIPHSEKMVRESRADKSAQDQANKDAMNKAILAEARKADEERAAAERRAKLAKQKAALEEARTQKAAPVKTTKSKVVEVMPAGMPPHLNDDIRPQLEKLAEPAVEFSRLPAARLSAIAIKILKLASLSVQELSEILHRTPVSVRKNVIQQLADDEHLKSQGKYYYYEE